MIPIKAQHISKEHADVLRALLHDQEFDPRFAVVTTHEELVENLMQRYVWRESDVKVQEMEFVSMGPVDSIRLGFIGFESIGALRYYAPGGWPLCDHKSMNTNRFLTDRHHISCPDCEIEIYLRYDDDPVDDDR